MYFVQVWTCKQTVEMVCTETPVFLPACSVAQGGRARVTSEPPVALRAEITMAEKVIVVEK